MKSAFPPLFSRRTNPRRCGGRTRITVGQGIPPDLYLADQGLGTSGVVPPGPSGPGRTPGLEMEKSSDGDLWILARVKDGRNDHSPLAGVPACGEFSLFQRRRKKGNHMTKVRQVQGFTTIVFGLLGLLGCSSTTEPPSLLPTLFVRNPLCDSLGCRPLQLRAFVWAFQVPQPPWGLKAIDEIHGPTFCLSFPPTWQLVVSEEDPSGAIVKSDTTIWTPDDPIYLTIKDLETHDWLSATETFVPSEAPGWELMFSPGPSQGPPFSGLPFSAHLSPGERCPPS